MADEADMRRDGTKGGGAASHASQRWFGAVEAMIRLVPAKRKKVTSEKSKNTYNSPESNRVLADGNG
jgi:hypothetical protein